jgi:hypothetical protein
VNRRLCSQLRPEVKNWVQIFRVGENGLTQAITLDSGTQFLRSSALCGLTLLGLESHLNGESRKRFFKGGAVRAVPNDEFDSTFAGAPDSSVINP